MRSACLWLIAVVMTVPAHAYAPPERDPADELRRLQGDWIEVCTVYDGQDMTRTGKDAHRFSFVGSRLISVQASEVFGESDISVDASFSPRGIDERPLDGQFAGKTLRGIYRLDGDTCTFCYSIAPGTLRPTSFDSLPESGTCLVVLRRINP